MPQTLCMPALSPTMTEGNLVKWLKAEGDIVKAGQVLAEIETDKATMDVEAVDEGTLGRILIPAGGDAIPVNTPIAIILEEGESAADLAAHISSLGADAALKSPPSGTGGQKPSASESAPAVSPSDGAICRGGAATTGTGRITASPLARRIAQDQGIDLAGIPGTGPRGRIVKADVLTASKNLGSGVLPPSGLAVGAMDDLDPPYRSEPLSTMRKVIANRLTESKTTIPHFYLSLDCVLDKLLRARQDLNKTLPGDGKVSVNDFMIKAAAMALSRVPAANAAFMPDGIRFYDRVDMSVAVAIDGGLVTPIIRDAARKSLGVISAEMKDLASRARAGKLKPHEFQGGTFSLSNLGMFGIREFAAIINPPQGGILAVGAGEERVIVKDGTMVIATVMSCTLSADHRVIDGAVGAQFLSVFQSLINNPVLMLY